MVKQKVQQGFIGFFDILGYQNYLINNDSITGANQVIKVLNSLKDEIPNKLKKMYKHPANISIIKNLNFLIFSDTILISIENKTSKNLSEKVVSNIRSIILLTATNLLVQKLFKYGLPFRGVINYGNYIIEDYCFAGNVIVESYQLTNKLDVATVVISDNFMLTVENTLSEIQQEIDNITDNKRKKSYLNAVESLNGIYATNLADYLIPYNDGSEEKMKTLNIFNALELSKNDSSNIPQFVHNIFWKHKKDIPKSAQNKVDNTVKLLRYLKIH